MVNLPSIDQDYLLSFLVKLLNIHSPTGYTEQAVDHVEQSLRAFPHVKLERTSKGALIATLPGEQSDTPRALSAHVDTLGAMVKEIKPSGRLALTRIGGLIWNAVETEGCTVFTSNGTRVRGSILVNKASGHVHGQQVIDLKREDATMEVRLDAKTSSAEETRKLGIEVGDFIAIDPRVEINNGFIRSRFLDDKACVACLAACIKALADAGLKPLQKTYFYFTNYEEVGHGGAAGFPTDADELLINDMAAVGEGQTSDEFHSTLCVKDSGGPYYHALNQHLRQLAEHYNIPYKVDIFTYYGSDGTAYWRAGGSGKVALIGPGIDASHNYERAHLEGLLATVQWNLAYLLN